MRPSHHSVRLRDPTNGFGRYSGLSDGIANRYPRLPRAFAGTLLDFFSEPALGGSYEGA